MHKLLISKGKKPRLGRVLECPCGKSFYQSPSRNQKFCSRKCKSSINLIRINYVCKICGKKYFRYPSQIKWRGQTVACSKQCRAISEIGKYTPQYLRDLRKINVKRGKNSNLWTGGVSSINRRIRASADFKNWRTKIFERDNYTCQYCKKRGGIELHPHHIKPFAYYPELRFRVQNGVTLCKNCHKETDTYGKRATSIMKREEAIQNMLVCMGKKDV